MVFIGGAGYGKTTLINKIYNNTFNQNNTMSAGAHFYVKLFIY